MPYAPGIEYRGDQYLFQGITGLGRSIGAGLDEAVRKRQELEKQAALNDTLVNHALQTGRITHDEYNNYVQGNWTKKQGIANGIMANIADDWKRNVFAQEQGQRQAEMAQRWKIANLPYGFEPSDADRAAGYRAGGEIVPVGKGQYRFVPYGGDDSTAAGPTPVDPVKDPSTGQIVPGVGIVRKTGQPIYTGGLTGGGVKIEEDPATGTLFYRDAKGNPRALTGQQVLAGQLSKAVQPAATATPTPAPQRSGVGGYIPGKRYAGKLYLGGDPNDPQNWQ